MPIMLDSSFSSSSLSPSFIPATSSFDYRPRLYDCVNHLRAFGTEKQRLLACLRKCVVKSADLRLSLQQHDLIRLLESYAKLRVAVCKFSGMKYGCALSLASLRYFRSFLLVTKRYGPATSMRIMSIR